MKDKHLILLLLTVIFALGSILFFQSFVPIQKAKVKQEETILQEQKKEEFDLSKKEMKETQKEENSTNEKSMVQKNELVSAEETIQSYLNILHLSYEPIELKIKKMEPFVTANYLEQIKKVSTDNHEHEESEAMIPSQMEMRDVEIIPQKAQKENVFIVEYVVIQTIEGSVFPNRIKATYTMVTEQGSLKISTINYQFEEEKTIQKKEKTNQPNEEEQEMKESK